MTEKELLRILQKYGFHSAKNAPFLYARLGAFGDRYKFDILRFFLIIAQKGEIKKRP